MTTSRISPNVVRTNGFIDRNPPSHIRFAVYLRDDFTCRDCGFKRPSGKSFGSVQAWHITAINGGDHTIENMITVCFGCRLRQYRERKLNRKRPFTRKVEQRQTDRLREKISGEDADS